MPERFAVFLPTVSALSLLGTRRRAVVLLVLLSIAALAALQVMILIVLIIILIRMLTTPIFRPQRLGGHGRRKVVLTFVALFRRHQFHILFDDVPFLVIIAHLIPALAFDRPHGINPHFAITI